MLAGIPRRGYDRSGWMEGSGEEAGAMAADEATIQAYRAAWERWQADLQQLHDVLLDGKQLDPMRRIALLRRESHSKERYEAARAALLGTPAPNEDDSPFGPE